ncbi:unnamed protein product [Prunus armeniaca]|uniref:Uncharacterized protein n=1 Tax=Prunus armeniaca TaxID=36596 RepID=A0A6J5V2Z8_PRUAR|nr:unnamed protein product [Prunus armeniaca]
MPKNAAKLPSTENKAETAEDEKQQAEKPNSACAKPLHCDILELRSTKLSFTLWALLPKPKNASVKTLSPKFTKLLSTVLALLPTPKSAAKLPSAETAEDENAEAEHQRMLVLRHCHISLQSYILHFWHFCQRQKSVTKLPSAENEAETTEDENVEAEKQQAEKPKSAYANPPHCDTLEPKSAKVSYTLRTILPKPKHAGVNTLSPKSESCDL